MRPSLQQRLSALLSLLAMGGLPAGSEAAPPKKPNFVYVLCDDMNELLGDEAIVKQTRSLLADQGARATNAYVSSPKCTPRQSSGLSLLGVKLPCHLASRCAGPCASHKRGRARLTPHFLLQRTCRSKL